MRRSVTAQTLLLLMPLVILAIFIIYPVSVVLIEGLLDPRGSTLAEVLSSPIVQRIGLFTFTQAALSTILSVVIGLPAAVLLARFRFKGRSIVHAALIVPFVLPPIVVVVGFLRMFGPYGILDTMAMAILGSSTSVLDLASGMGGIVLAHAFYNVPLVTLMVSASLERLNPEVEEAAELLGATSIKKWQRIIFPQIRPALAASSILTFLFCFMSFPIVLALGHGQYSTIEVEIWSAFRMFDYGEASSLALMQLVVTLSLAASYFKLGGQQSGDPGKTATIKTFTFSSMNIGLRLAVIAYVIAMVFLMVGPIAAIGFAAIYDPVVHSYSLDGFANLLVLGTGGGLLPLINSVVYASMATFFAIVLGIPLAYAQVARGKTLPKVSSIMIMLPLGISSITIAYGLLRAIAVPLGLSTNPWLLIVIAQTVIGLPFSARSIELALRNIDPELLQQADSLGASRFQRLFFVELPLLAPGILVGGVFAFAMAIGEMSATIFIALPQNYTLAVSIYQYLAVRKFLEAGAAAFVLVIVCLVAFLVIQRVSGEAAGGAL
ncbi:MAG: ABC transporter permease [Candidatus Thorarchaeota archaeon]